MPASCFRNLRPNQWLSSAKGKSSTSLICMPSLVPDSFLLTHAAAFCQAPGYYVHFVRIRLVLSLSVLRSVPASAGGVSLVLAFVFSKTAVGSRSHASELHSVCTSAQEPDDKSNKSLQAAQGRESNW